MEVHEFKVHSEITPKNLQEVIERNLLEDGFITPMLFIVNDEGAVVGDITKYIAAEGGKERLIMWLEAEVKRRHAHRVLVITELWTFKPPEDMPQEEIETIIREGRVEEEFTTGEAYQILSFTRETIDSVARRFTREGDKVTLGEEISDKNVTIERFVSVQRELAQIN